MPSISLLSANLLTVCLESLFYGVVLVLFLASMYILAQRQHRASPLLSPQTKLWTLLASPMFVASIGLFAANTAHWVLAVTRLFQAFVYYDDGANPTQFYQDLGQKTYIAQLGALTCSVIFGDAVFIYRLWIVWAYSRLIIIIPLCSLVGYIVCGVGVTYQTSRFIPGDNVDQVSAAVWITPLWAFTICTNVYCTALIAWRIWRTQVQISRSEGNQKLADTIITLVESAALYTAWNIFYYITYALQSQLQFVINQTVPAMGGIAFMLINVRVGLNGALRAPREVVDVSSRIRFASATPWASVATTQTIDAGEGDHEAGRLETEVK